MRQGWVLHAFCLMGNHYHLLVETPEANLVQGMRQLNEVYTRACNRSDVEGAALSGVRAAGEAFALSRGE